MKVLLAAALLTTVTASAADATRIFFTDASQELEFWLDGKRVTRVKRAAGPKACRGQDLGVLSRARVGCPTGGDR